MGGRTGRAWRLSPKLALVAVCATYALVCLAWNWTTPANEGYDEPSHIGYVEQIVSTGHLPRLPSPNLEGHQPPAYYLIQAALVSIADLPFPPGTRIPAQPGPMPRALWDHRGECHLCGGMFTLRLMRLVSTGLGLVTLLLVFAALSRVLADGFLAASGTAAVALIPQFQYVTSTVNNDALVFAVAAGFALAVVTMVQASGARRFYATAAAAGALLGVGLWSKEYAFALIPVFALGILVSRRRPGEMAAAALAGAGCWLLVAAPLLVRNWHLYHALWPFRAEVANIARILPASVVPRHLGDPVLWRVMPGQMWMSFWFSGGGGQVKLPAPVYDLILAIAVLLAAGAAVALIRGRRGASGFDLRAAVPLLATPGFLYAGAFYAALKIQQFPGRYLFPGLAGIALWLALAGTLPSVRRYRPSLIGGLIAGLAVLSVTAVVASARVLSHT